MLIVVLTNTLLSHCGVPISYGSIKKQDNVSLSPADWPEGEFERFERLSLSPAEPKPLALSFGKGMVSGTTSAFAVHSGIVALRKGGNAMDACITTALARK